MKFFSLERIFSVIREVIFRFPLSVVIAILGTSGVVYAVGNSVDVWVEKSIVVSVAIFFLGLALALFVERVGRGKLLAHSTILLFAVGYYWFLPEGGFKEFQKIDTIQTFLLTVILALLVCIALYIGKKEINGFWQYNKRLIIRLFFTAISVGTLFVGISLSLASADFLFGLNVDFDWYSRIWVAVVGIIGTFIFMAGIPKEYHALETERTYPKVIEVFSKYILLPLVTLYAGILYLYGGKILVTGEWPKGTVSLLVILYAFFGMITMLLLYPLREREHWVKKVSRVFYGILLPLTMLLFAAVYIRISEYGLTESRVAGVVFGVWLVGVSFYFLIGKQYDIRYVYFSFVVVMLVFSFGPVSVFALSRESQVNRLKALLEKHAILVEGKLKDEQHDSVSKKDLKEISSIVDYLGEVRGLKKLSPWFETSVEGWDSKKILKKMHLEYTQQWDASDDGVTTYFSADTSEDVIDVSGFDLLYRFRCYDDCFKKEEFELKMNKEKNVLEVMDEKGDTLPFVDFSQQNRHLKEKHGGGGAIPGEELIFSINQNGVRMKMILYRFSLQQKGEENVLRSATGVLLVSSSKK